MSRAYNTIIALLTAVLILLPGCTRAEEARIMWPDNGALMDDGEYLDELEEALLESRP